MARIQRTKNGCAASSRREPAKAIPNTSAAAPTTSPAQPSQSGNTGDRSEAPRRTLGAAQRAAKRAEEPDKAKAGEEPHEDAGENAVAVLAEEIDDLARVGVRIRRLGLRLVGRGRGCTREALGSTVTLLGERPQLREVQSANGFSAQHDTRVHFGLDRISGPVDVEVRWCGAERRRYRLTANRYHTLRR